MMLLPEAFWATRMLTSESNSKEDLPWIIQYFTEFLVLITKKIQLLSCKITAIKIRNRK
jgi:hypothetical protein